MPLDIVRGRISNVMATKELIPIIEKLNAQNDATLYLGYPLSANAENTVTVDALFVSNKIGIVAFIFTKLENLDEIIEEQGELYFQLTNTLTQYPNLRKGRSLAVDPHVISIVPAQMDGELEDGYILSTFDDLPNAIDEIPTFDTKYYKVLVESLQRIASIKPRKKRENVKNSGSKGDIIKKIEKEIANLDHWQKKAALEIVDGPQRIRGLAGSGKTIVLALKAAYLHSQFPEWDIVVTYYTRALWQQYRDLITKFVFEFSRDEPNWDKLHLFHAWGSQSEQGIYSEIARSIGQVPVNFANAKLKYGREKAFSGICDELKQDATPPYFNDLLDPKDVIITKRFEDVDMQYDYVAQQIKKNITEDELDPDDILVIFPSVISAKSQYQRFAQHLARYSISSMLAGVTNDRDIFRVPGSISCSAIYRAKGNEAPMVYIVNADFCYDGIELIKLRNTLFTAITRSRAWVRICGVGYAMDGLIEEINKFITKNYVLEFKIPTKTEMARLRTINRERSASDTKKIEEAQKGVRTLLELVNQGDLDASQIPELSSLVKLFLSSKSDGDNVDEEDE